MKRLITVILAFVVAAVSFANDNQVTRINDIKKSSDYIYGDATMPTQADAISLAYEKLQSAIQEWSQVEHITLKVKSVIEINNLADTILTRRADMYRVFAYVKKSDLASDTMPKDSLVTDSVMQVIKQRFGGKNSRQSDALLRIKEAKNFFELKQIMQPLKENGKIIDYGKFATAEHPERCYLIVYDPAGNIRAILDKGGDIRKNLKTGGDDSIRNYRGCGAIWFLLPE